MENQKVDMRFNMIEHPFDENESHRNHKKGFKKGVNKEIDLNNKAGFFIRAQAFIIDLAILNIIYLFFLFAGCLAVYLALQTQDLYVYLGKVKALPIPCNFIITAITIGYFIYFHGATGQTIGKMVCKIKVVQKNGDPLNYSTSFLRWVGYVLSSIALYIGFFWIAFDKNKQGWHDKIANTCVIKLKTKKA
ncbi:MAG: RDD family protein [Thermodesulfobacteriota bacterium]|nr:RDD family protein [Thermodesulfobacteriota bacterium]